MLLIGDRTQEHFSSQEERLLGFCRPQAKSGPALGYEKWRTDPRQRRWCDGITSDISMTVQWHICNVAQTSIPSVAIVS